MWQLLCTTFSASDRDECLLTQKLHIIYWILKNISIRNTVNGSRKKLIWAQSIRRGRKPNIIYFMSFFSVCINSIRWKLKKKNELLGSIVYFQIAFFSLDLNVKEFPMTKYPSDCLIPFSLYSIAISCYLKVLFPSIGSMHSIVELRLVFFLPFLLKIIDKHCIVTT